MENVTLPQIVTAIVAVLGFGLSLYNFYSQRWGPLHCHMYERVKKGLSRDRDGDRVYTFDVRFFNGKGVATGIRDCTIAFCKNNADQFEGIKICPKDAVSGYRADAFTFKPQEFLAQTLEVKIKVLADSCNKKRQKKRLTPVKEEDVEKIIEEADKVVFEGSWPTGKPFRQEIIREETEE
jgi:hypothetical protein